jgi:Domain of unknown function (DUF222)
MSQPSVPGHGLGEEPARGSRLPSDLAAASGPSRLGLGDFAKEGAADTCPPGPALVTALDELSGPQWRCDGATDDELIGLLGRWTAAESWAAAAKLGVLRELIRRRAVPIPGTMRPGGLPDVWDKGTGHEVAGALGISLQAADRLLDLAWTLEARLPGIGAKLADGTITCTTAKIIADELSVLDDARAAEAEKLVLADLAGKTPGQAGKLAALAVATVDPEGTQKRREQAERDEARVRIWREHSGATAMAAYGLPTDAALAANANIEQRAETYKKSGAFPGATMGQLRVLAFCDSINGTTADDRIALAQSQAQSEDQAQSQDQAAPPEPSGQAGHALPAKANLTFPLATLLGLADRPGLGYGLGALDPALVRGLAAAAARSPHSDWCVTITDASGYAIGHGCAKPARAGRKRGKSPPTGNRDGPWSFTRQDDPGPPGGFGTWLLTLPDGQRLTVKLGPIPVTDCDHRYESRAYQPSDTLRHLVEIRDGTCTFPSCSRHASNCDFEHATPYDQGGRTCACNAGARSRRCHKVKQSQGWTVTQPRPGWHQWQTPSGRTYTQGPMKHPA